MITKNSNSPQRTYGRNLQFIDPSIRSNKKNCWNYGQGNLGFLTSQQIQILKQMKRKQRDLSAINHLRPSYENIDMSSISLNKQSNNHQSSSHEFSKDQKNYQVPISKIKKEQKVINRQNKIFFSHSRQQVLSESSVNSNSSRKNVSSSKMLQKIQQETRKKQKIQIKLPINNKRIKTLEIERLYNPQNFGNQEKGTALDSKRQVSSNLKRKLKSRIDLHSKSVNVEVRSDFHFQSKKNFKPQKMKKKINLDSENLEIQKDQINLRPLIKQHKQNQVQQTQQVPAQPLYKSKKFFQTKVHTRTKFRRDFSPTYCNSFGYPLNCYRYV